MQLIRLDSRAAGSFGAVYPLAQYEQVHAALRKALVFFFLNAVVHYCYSNWDYCAIVVERCVLLQCVAVGCSMLQYVAVCCSMLLCVAVCRSVLLCVTVCCSVLQCVAVICSVSQRVAVCCSAPLLSIRYCCLQDCLSARK